MSATRDALIEMSGDLRESAAATVAKLTEFLDRLPREEIPGNLVELQQQARALEDRLNSELDTLERAALIGALREQRAVIDELTPRLDSLSNRLKLHVSEATGEESEE